MVAVAARVRAPILGRAEPRQASDAPKEVLAIESAFLKANPSSHCLREADPDALNAKYEKRVSGLVRRMESRLGGKDINGFGEREVFEQLFAVFHRGGVHYENSIPLAAAVQSRGRAYNCRSAVALLIGVPIRMGWKGKLGVGFATNHMLIVGEEFALETTDPKSPVLAKSDLDAVHGWWRETGVEEGLVRSARNWVGMMLNRELKFGEALEVETGLVKTSADFPEAWVNISSALICLKRFEEAVSAADRAIRLNPAHPDAWNNRGAALDLMSMHEEALKSYDKSIEIDPQYAVAWSNRGEALDGLGRHEEAIAAFDSALRLNPRLVQTLTYKADLLDRLGRHEEAHACAELAKRAEAKNILR